MLLGILEYRKIGRSKGGWSYEETEEFASEKEAKDYLLDKSENIDDGFECRVVLYKREKILRFMPYISTD